MSDSAENKEPTNKIKLGTPEKIITTATKVSFFEEGESYAVYTDCNYSHEERGEKLKSTSRKDIDNIASYSCVKTTKIDFSTDKYKVVEDYEYNPADRGTDVTCNVLGLKTPYDTSVLDKYTVWALREGLPKMDSLFDTTIGWLNNKNVTLENQFKLSEASNDPNKPQRTNIPLGKGISSILSDRDKEKNNENLTDKLTKHKESNKEVINTPSTREYSCVDNRQTSYITRFDNDKLTEYRNDGYVYTIGNCCSHTNEADKIWNVLKSRLDSYRGSGLGRLYVEPFYNNGSFKPFVIPFEFNATITEGDFNAKYQTEQLLGKTISLNSYVGSEVGSYSLETKYMALAPDNENEYEQNRYGTYCYCTTNNQINAWMQDWTNRKIEVIEKQLRSLVLPNNDYKNFVRPPIVSIIMRAGDRGECYSHDGSNLNPYSTIGDLYKYPQYIDESVSPNVLNPYINITKLIDGDYNNVYKRFIATSVKITPLDQYNNSYKIPSDYVRNVTNQSNYNELNYYGDNPKDYRRNGFSVSLTLVETTKNFLDILPDYKSYYCSWMQKLGCCNGSASVICNDGTFAQAEDQAIANLNSCVQEFWKSIYNLNSQEFIVKSNTTEEGVNA